MKTKDESVSPRSDSPSPEKLASQEDILTDTSQILIRTAEKSGRPLSDILETYHEIIAKDSFQAIPVGMREKVAARAVKAKIAWEARVQTHPFEILVIGISHGNPRKRVPGKIATILTSLEDKTMVSFYRVLTLWNDNSTKIDNLIIGHNYHANLARKRSADSLDAWDPVDETEFVHKGRSRDDPMDVICDIPVTPIADAEFNLSKGWTDYRRIDGEVMGCHITSNGTGMIFVVDESSNQLIYGDPDRGLEPVGGFTVFSDPVNLVYGDGSEIALVGRISKDSEGRVIMNADALVPILTVPRMTDSQDVDVDYDRPVVDPASLDLDDDEW